MRGIILLALISTLVVSCTPRGVPSSIPSSIPSPISPSATPTPTSAPGGPSWTRLVGVTLDNPYDTGAVTAALKQLPKPAVRIVFDEKVPAKVYAPIVAAIRPHAGFVMGELLDSYFVKDCDLACYEKRTRDYLTLPLDVLEVGNEINGDQSEGKNNWVGADAWKKAALALRLAHAAGRRTAVTFYLQPDMAMFAFIEKIPADERALIDYALVSYYEKDNGEWSPDWQAVIDRLGALLPGAALGVGECGDDRSRAKAEPLFDRYYRKLKVVHPRYVFGGFWWYQAQIIGRQAFLLPALKAASE